MRQKASGQVSGFGVAVLLSCMIATALSIIFAKSVHLFILNENQMLYLFSAMAQVMGSVFGLTLTAYVFFVDKFKESTDGDDTLYDATSALLKSYFHILIILAAVCGIVVLTCIAGIIDLHNWLRIYPFVLNEAVFLFSIGIIAILIFGVMLLDPDKLYKELKYMKKDAEKNDPYFSKKELGNFTDFLRTYNLLEKLIKKFADSCMGMQQVTTYGFKNKKPQIIQALEVLNQHEYINGALLEELNTFRIYRNGLVHGVDFDVTIDVCKRISEIYSTLENAYHVFQKNGSDSEEWKIAIRKVYDLSR